jgi:formylglycine-generating enzyme required for sulfatase activity
MANLGIAHPKVFISYSHDSPQHNDLVLELFNRLRSDGIDCVIDQCEPAPSEGWARWMDKQIQEADFILMICTEIYFRRVMGQEELGKGLGVRWEGHLIYDYIYQAGTTNTKFIPILIAPGKTEYIPTPLRAYPHYLAFTDSGYEELYRRLTNQPRDLKPALGKLKTLPPRERRALVPYEGEAIIPKGLRAFDQLDTNFFLQLLPGPRDNTGLPESIRFWKTRIESTDEDESFRVGLMYGPSGCGKTSLVKAGLLTRLSTEIITVYVESTSEDTELRLLAKLRKICTSLDSNLGLMETVSCLASGHATLSGKKVLLILDQFEQWLNSHPRPSQSDELVAALRLLKTENMQCLLMIRDDFWAATDRFFEQVKIDMVQGYNFRLVDLFDQDHAKRVLQLFGFAYNRLPANPEELSKEQLRFIQGAIDGLHKNGFVVPIRLSLFADLMKGRPWTEASLNELGGIGGVGVRFLEETFNSDTSVPRYRAIQEPARAVLQALLPDQGTNLKGKMRSSSELASTCELQDEPERFNRVLDVLGHELHLISATEKILDTKKGSSADVERREGYYQLTHDFMVTPLRDWLTQERRKSWRGRAEVTLEERTAQWVSAKRRRDLPVLSEFLITIAGVPRSKWTSQQRQLLYKAARHHVSILSLIFIVIAVVGWGMWIANAPLRARLLVQAILAARPDELERLIENDLAPYHRWADPILKEVVADNNAEPGKKLRASLALVSSDSSQLNYLSQRLLDCNVDEYPVIRKILAPYHRSIEPQLWDSFRAAPSDKARFYAGMALALYDPESDKWTKADINYIAEQLLKSNPDYQRDLRSYLKSIAGPLLEPLQTTFSDEAQRDTIRKAAALALIDYQRENPGLLAKLVSEATSEQYDVIYQTLHAPDVNLQSVQSALVEITKEQPVDSLTEVERIRLGKRRAGAAITLMHLGARESIFNIFKIQKDPESLTQFIHRLRDRNVNPAELLECLDHAQDEEVRFALLLALGEYKQDAIPAIRRSSLIENLLQWYREDPSSAIHSATGWLLKSWGIQDEVARLDYTPVPLDQSGRRQWFIQQIGDNYMTFIVLKPGEFMMGSPESEKGHQQNEKLHSVTITRPFAICDREVTKGLFQQFLKEMNRSITNIDEWSPNDNDPAVKVSWYEAVLFCRWLTIKAGMSEADQYYEDPDKLPKGADGFPAEWTVHLDRQGFRLPIEAEWEYACRSGTKTTYGFGSDTGLLQYYAWFLNNSSSVSGHTTHAAASLRPNLWGIFDMHGNVWEWCNDRYGSKPGYDEITPKDTNGAHDRLIRSGSWHSDEGYNRSASRYVFPPETKDNLIGFRVVGGLR